MREDAAAIVCEQLTRRYETREGALVALDEIDLTVEAGGIFGILGPNGAGKTTLVRVLTTLLLPSAGRGVVGGFDVASEAARVRLVVGLVLGGERGLYGRLSGRDNLRFFAALWGVGHSEARRRAAAMLSLVGLAAAADRKVEEYSRGMKQRLHLARGLMTDPEILFLDEPTIGLDPVGAQQIWDALLELRGRGKTVILTSHDLNEVETLCSRIALIDHGRLVFEGTPTEVRRLVPKREVVSMTIREPVASLEGAVTDRIPGVSYERRERFAVISAECESVPVMLNQLLVLLDGQEIVELSIERPTLRDAYLQIFGARTPA